MRVENVTDRYKPRPGEEPRDELPQESPGHGQLGILATDMVAVVLQVRDPALPYSTVPNPNKLTLPYHCTLGKAPQGMKEPL